VLSAEASELRVAHRKYEQAWRDLRRRDMLFRIVALSFVPGVLVIMAGFNAMYGDVPRHFGRLVGGGWIVAFFVVGTYRRRFR
jgi:hypothetical protein